jgi:hypothetical protein
VRRAENLTTFICRLYRNSGSFNLSRPVQGLLYLFMYKERLKNLHLGGVGWGWWVRMYGVHVDVIVTCEVYKVSHSVQFLSAKDGV